MKLPTLRLSRPAARHITTISAAALKFSQPVHETHPHILQPGELTPGITAQEYADRRAALAHALPPGSLAVLQSAPMKYKSGAVFHPYRQESNFFYLTGWSEPDALALIRNTGPSHGDYEFTMLVRPKHAREEQWSGYRNGVAAASDVFNADEAFSIERADALLPELIRSSKMVYAEDDVQKYMGSRRVLELRSIVDKLRAVKSPAEVAIMRLAGQRSGRAITQAMGRAWTREKDLHAFLDYTFVMNGCDAPAYIPVVAGGDRGNCIHYTANDNVLLPGDMVLVDAGGECGTYITDISRTWPVSGSFTPAQRDLYQAVLNVQRSCVALCRASSRLSLEDIHGITVRGLVDQLRNLGFDVGQANVHELFPHHVGHYIGLDVHDTPSYSRRETLNKGHCVTIEPGVYVPNDERWPAHFRGMGVRIEDSICVDDHEPLVLTTEAVKEIADIEALRS